MMCTSGLEQSLLRMSMEQLLTRLWNWTPWYVLYEFVLAWAALDLLELPLEGVCDQLPKQSQVYK